MIRFKSAHTIVNRQHLRLLHHLVVMPAVSYAAPAWWYTSQHSMLRARVRSLLRSTLFAVTGAYTTTRTAALEVIANTLPLDIHLDIQVLMFLLFSERQSITFNSINCEPSDVDLPIDSLTHPARLIRISSGRLNAADANQRLRIPGLHAYTDGSHTSTSAGAGFVIMSGPDSITAVRRYRLVTPTSSFDVEALALNKLLQFLLDNPPSSPVHIYTDSLSVLTALDNPFNQSTVVHQLKIAILSLANVVSVHLYHVPGHSGVWGNELADMVAASAATRGEDARGKLSKRMMRSRLTKEGHLQWQRRWSTENTDTELYRWIPNVLDIPSFFPPPKKLTQLIDRKSVV